MSVHVPSYIIKELTTGRGYASRRLSEGGGLVDNGRGVMVPEYAYKRRDKWTIYYYHNGIVNLEHDDHGTVCPCCGELQ